MLQAFARTREERGRGLLKAAQPRSVALLLLLLLLLLLQLLLLPVALNQGELLLQEWQLPLLPGCSNRLPPIEFNIQQICMQQREGFIFCC